MALSPSQIAETRASLAKHDGNLAAVARELKLARSTVQNRVERLPTNDNVPAPQDQFSEYVKIHGQEKPRYRVKAISSERLSDEPIYKILAVGDTHDKPGRSKERFRWIGAHAAAIKPDAVVFIGDVASLDSLSTHEQPGSANDADRPAFHEELDSLDEALSEYHSATPVGEIPTWVTLGNHEYRAWRAANRQPKLSGDLPVRLEQVFARYRWQTRPFGEALDLYGVDFVHCYLNKMGREVGGDNLNLIANKCSRSLVMGHTHVNGVFNQAKYGHDYGKSRKITVVNLGTAMPYGIVEKYSGLSTTGWGYGVYELRIQAGVILTAKPIDMLELMEMYS